MTLALYTLLDLLATKAPPPKYTRVLQISSPNTRELRHFDHPKLHYLFPLGIARPWQVARVVANV
jgi:hypothetical protein